MEFDDNHDEMSHIIDAPFYAYDGSDPYIFVCYSHKDSSIVFDDLEEFNNLGVNVFYDEGLPSGYSWFESIENKIKKSKLFIAFISQNTVESKPSRKEIFLAFRLNIPILPIFIEQTKLEHGLDYAIGDEHSIFKYALDSEKYAHYYIREFKRHGFDINIKNEVSTPDLPTYHEKHQSLLSKSLSNLLEASRQKYYLTSACESEPIAHATKAPSGKLGVFSRVMSSVFGKNDSLPHTERPKQKRTSPTNHHNNDYIYISFSNRDVDLVFPQIESFKHNGYDVKFNDDMSSETQLINDSTIFVVFISNDSINSKIIEKEISVALSRNKPIIPIYLEEINEGTQVTNLISDYSGISMYNLPDNNFFNEYSKAFDKYYSKSPGDGVFISYSSKDQDIAYEVCNYLERNNMSCWIAPRDILVANNYVNETVNAIKNSDMIVLIFSKNANESSYVINEIDYAFSCEKPIITFKIDDYLPDGSLEFFLKNQHWIDAYSIDFKEK